MAEEVEIAGLTELYQALYFIDQKQATKGVRKAVGAGLAIMIRDARQMVPIRSGQLKKSIGRKVKTYRTGKVAVGLIGARKGFATAWQGKRIDPYKYSHLAEKGTSHSQARPFLEPAYSANVGAVQDKMAEIIGQTIEEGWPR